jgi:hypothetical protein
MDMRNERGIALVFVLFLVTTISALAVSLTFLAQSETISSGNYRLATQARYAAESGAQNAADFLLGGAYVAATAAPGLVDNNAKDSPVLWGGKPVVLSANPLVASNYPNLATQTAFNTAVRGALPAGSATIGFGAYATLIHEEQFGDAYGGGNTIVQTWQITSDGTVLGIRPATVEITSTIETPKVPAFSYAAFATANGCGALTFKGNTGTDSYNSATLPAGTAPTSCPSGTTGPACYKTSGGDVGTNGNMLIDGGSVDVNGNLSTPRAGVGACTAGNVTALSGSLSEIGGSPIQLPKAVTLPTPQIPTPAPGGALKVNNSAKVNSICTDLGLTAANCNVDNSGAVPVITLQNTNLTPLHLQEIDLSAHANIVLMASTNPAITNEYDFNAISLTGGSSIGVSTPAPDAKVVVRVSGQDTSGPIDPAINFDGGTYAAPVGTCTTCSAYDATLLQFVYGGSSTVVMTGNSAASATIYAPNAPATLKGTSDLYGAIVANTIQVSGDMNIHYDQQLQSLAWTHGVPMQTAFSWKNKNN